MAEARAHWDRNGAIMLDPLALLVTAIAGLLVAVLLLAQLLPSKRVVAEFPRLDAVHDDFLARWTACARDLGGRDTASFADSETAARAALRQLALTVQDVQRASSRGLFLAHRLAPTAFEGGLAIRLTVHCNLFCGTLANLGSPAQLEFLQRVLDRVRRALSPTRAPRTHSRTAKRLSWAASPSRRSARA